MGALRHSRTLNTLGKAVRPIAECGEAAESATPEAWANLYVAFRDAQPHCQAVIAEFEGAFSFGGTYGAAEGQILQGTRIVANAALVGERSYEIHGDRIRSVETHIARQAVRTVLAAWRMALE